MFFNSDQPDRTLDKNKKYLILIGGPTASGKTSLAIKLAQYFDCKIISADSRQFYREMTIGTAKPSNSELSSVKHHFINSLSIFDSYSVGQFEEEAIKLIKRLLVTKDYVIGVGGTGLYLKSLYEGVDKFPEVSAEDVQYYQNLFNSQGLRPLQEELSGLDQIYAQSVDMNNPHRLIRALSVMKATGKTFSSFRTKKKVDRVFTTIKLKIDIGRDILYNRINTRVDQMIEDGLVDEALTLHNHKHLNSLNTVGYKELFKHFNGEWTLDQSIEKIKQHTRNYAKRQITWFNNQGNWQSIKSSDEAIAIIKKIVDHSK